ncbi:hypothetical protein HYW20_01065 [Candidatus Woesearchaeota archaeon]|nr:hypothetical protein [Candidatus Woesearchaeota archaeon]
MYENIIQTGAGVLAGVLLRPVYYNKIKPFFRAVRLSGVPITKIDTKKATSLDRALSEWSSLDPSLKEITHLGTLREAMPKEVQEVFDRRINNDGVYLTIKMDDPAATLENLLQRRAALRERVQALYEEPVFQAYLKKHKL